MLEAVLAIPGDSIAHIERIYDEYELFEAVLAIPGGSIPHISETK